VFRFSSFFFQKKLEIVQFFPFGIVVGFFSVLNMVIGVVYGFFVPNSHQHLYKNPLELWLASFLFLYMVMSSSRFFFPNSGRLLSIYIIIKRQNFHRFFYPFSLVWPSLTNFVNVKTIFVRLSTTLLLYI
jgi:hypothetical protein